MSPSLTDSLARSQANEENSYILASGTLHIVTTPLGNLEDLSPRVKETLSACRIWAVEDTRRAKNLAQLIDTNPEHLIRCDEYALSKAQKTILDYLDSGQDVAFTTDAGVPCISDPGDRLVAAARLKGINISGIPGPSAVTLALSLSGFPATPFTFLGFLPKKQGQRQKMLQQMLQSEQATVFFESPFRIERTLTELAQLSAQRPIFVCRELTKKFEEHFWGSLSEVLKQLGKKSPKGEYTVVLSPLEKVKIRRKHTNKYKDTSDE